MAGYPSKSTGYVKRFGQNFPSTACGSIKGALSTILKSDGECCKPKRVDNLDYQQDIITEILCENRNRIKASTEDNMAEATQIIYEYMNARIQEIVIKNGDSQVHTLILVGGIVINVDEIDSENYPRPFFVFKDEFAFKMAKHSQRDTMNTSHTVNHVSRLSKINYTNEFIMKLLPEN